MSWEAEGFPVVLKQALDDGFIPAEASILDIGCGSGDIAARLAQLNYRTVGCDFSTAAIARAQGLHQHDLLQFEVRDVVELWQNPSRFDALFDRGCLHGLDDSTLGVYVQNAAASLERGGPFLLLHRLEKNQGELYPPGYVEEKVRSAFANEFDINSMCEIDMKDGTTGIDDAQIPGLAYRMTRR